MAFFNLLDTDEKDRASTLQEGTHLVGEATDIPASNRVAVSLSSNKSHGSLAVTGARGRGAIFGQWNQRKLGEGSSSAFDKSWRKYRNCTRGSGQGRGRSRLVPIKML